MRYKYLAAAVYLCMALVFLSAPVIAEQNTSHSPEKYHPHKISSPAGTGDTADTVSKTNTQTELNLIDTLWILGFTVAGLVLLRKVQGE